MANTQSNEQRFSQIMLSVLSSYVNHVITRRELIAGDYRVEIFAPMAQDVLVIQLQQHLLSQSREFETSYPRDWWEALKERFAPAWFVRRYPVRRDVWHVDARRVWDNAPRPETWGKEHPFVIVNQSEFPEDMNYEPDEYYS